MLARRPVAKVVLALFALILLGQERFVRADDQARSIKTPAIKNSTDGRFRETRLRTKLLLADARVTARYQVRSAREHIQEWRSERRIALEHRAKSL